MEKLLELKNATIRAGMRLILPSVSITLKASACLIIEGKNGIGKTVLLETLAGLRKAEGYTAPPVILCGDNKWGMKPRLTVFTNLQFYAALEGGHKGESVQKSATRIARAIRYFGLNSQAAVGKLSLGQRQKISLARLMLSDRKIWLLDEAGANLDKQGEQDLFALIARHRKNGGGVIMTRHRGKTPPKAQILSFGK